MFISSQAIQAIAEANTDPTTAQFIGLPVWYFAIVDNGNGVTSVDAVITRIRPGETGDAPFVVDLGINTSVPDIFLVLKDLTVVSMVLENRKEGTPLKDPKPALCLAAEIEEVENIVNAPRFGELKLVPKAD